MKKIGIYLRDPNQPVVKLSGGGRQTVAIARSIYFGTNKPTSELGVRKNIPISI